MKHFDVLSSHSSIPSKLFLEASAGTGKTFAIENLFVRLIVGAGCKSVLAEEILVVTFTKAATRELKERIAAELNRVLYLLMANKSSHREYLNGINPSERSIAIQRIKQAIACIESLEIFTLHGFCYRILSQHAFEANQIIFDSDEEAIKRDFKSFILDEFRALSDKVLNPIQLKILLRHFGQDFKSIVRELENRIDIDMQVSNVDSFEDAFKQFQERCKQLPKFSKSAILNDLSTLFSAYRGCLTKEGKLHEKFSKQVDVFLDIVSTQKVHIREFETLVEEKELFFELFSEDNRKKKVQEGLVQTQPLFEYVHNHWLPILEKVRNPHSILLFLIAQFQPKILRHFQFHPASFPDCLIHQMDHALKDPIFLDKLHHRYRVVIVDEFQDTDPVQWSILTKLCLKRKEELVLFALIGDPKQSIYSFRNADLKTYMKAKKAFGDQAIMALQTNYRSDKPLIDVLNRLFSIEGPLFTFKESEQELMYFQVNAGQQRRTVDERGHFHLHCIEGKEGRGYQWPSLDIEETIIFPHIAQQIIKYSESKVPLQNIAILVKDRFQAKRVQQALKKSRIPSYSVRRAAITKTEMYDFFCDFLKALSMPYRRTILKRLISHKMMGYSPNELIQESLFLYWQEKLVYLHRCFLNEGLGKVIELFIQDQDNRLSRCMLANHQLDHYSDFVQILSFLLEESLNKGCSLIDLFDALRELKLLDPDTTPHVRRELIGGTEAVQIMTTHVCKGLEFDVIFPIGIATRTSIDDPIVSLKKEGASQLIVAQFAIKETKQRYIELTEEKLRQLYVALTRAKQKIHLYYPIKQEAKKIPAELLSPLEVFLAKRIFQVHSYSELEEVVFDQTEIKRFFAQEFVAKESFEYDCLEDGIVYPCWEDKQQDVAIDFKPFPSKLDSSVFLSFSQCVRHRQVLKNKDYESRNEGLPRGPLVGTILHAILEKIIKRRLLCPLSIKQIEKVIEDQCDLTVLEGFEHLVLEIVMKAVQTPLVSGIALCDVKAQNIQQEVPFTYHLENNVFMKGIADLIFHIDEQYYILDWKSNDLGDEKECYSKENLFSAMEESEYNLQASIYAQAVQKWLSKTSRNKLGGVIYVFLRGLQFGSGVLHIEPDIHLVKQTLQKEK